MNARIGSAWRHHQRCYFLAFLTLACVSIAPSIATAQTLIFEDDLEDNSSGWTFDSLDEGFFGTLPDALTAIQNGQRVGSLGTAGFDYSTVGIPEAPNTDPGDTATTGFRAITNILDGDPPIIDGEGIEADQAAFVLQNPAFDGKYTVQVDMYINFSLDESLVGTTEFGGIFVGSDTVANPANPEFPIERGAGALFSTDGDCFNCDFLLLKNEAELDIASGQYSVTDFGFGNQQGWDNTDVNTNAANGIEIDLPTLFPSLDPIQQAGSVGLRWVTLTVDVDTDAAGMGSNGSTGTATFSVEIPDTGETFVLGTVDNSVNDDPNDGVDTGESPVDMSGQISLALVDFFPSLARNTTEAFALFDNLKVFESSLTGDFNDDSVVDAADYTVWRDGYTTGTYTIDDYLDWKTAFGTGAAAATSSVPEPTSLVLITIGFLSLARRKRRS